MFFVNDDQEIQLAYFMLDRFGIPPDVTARQDESVINDLMLMDRQIAWKRWAVRHNVEDDDRTVFGSDVLDYRKAFGLTESKGL